MTFVLSDCISRERGETELVVVREGMRLAAWERDPFRQAVLPVSSSMIRVEGADLCDLLDDEGVKSIIACLGAGIELVEGSPLTLDLGRLRYGKIILAFDRSAEGRHVREQVLAVCRRYMGSVVRAGHVFTVDLEDGNSKEELQRRALCAETRLLNPVV